MRDARRQGGVMVTADALQMLSTTVRYLSVLKDVAGLVILAMRTVPTVALNFELQRRS